MVQGEGRHREVPPHGVCAGTGSPPHGQGVPHAGCGLHAEAGGVAPRCVHDCTGRCRPYPRTGKCSARVYAPRTSTRSARLCAAHGYALPNSEDAAARVWPPAPEGCPAWVCAAHRYALPNSEERVPCGGCVWPTGMRPSARATRRSARDAPAQGHAASHRDTPCPAQGQRPAPRTGCAPPDGNTLLRTGRAPPHAGGAPAPIGKPPPHTAQTGSNPSPVTLSTVRPS